MYIFLLVPDIDLNIAYSIDGSRLKVIWLNFQHFNFLCTTYSTASVPYANEEKAINTGLNMDLNMEEVARVFLSGLAGRWPRLLTNSEHIVL